MDYQKLLDIQAKSKEKINEGFFKNTHNENK